MQWVKQSVTIPETTLLSLRPKRGQKYPGLGLNPSSIAKGYPRVFAPGPIPRQKPTSRLPNKRVPGKSAFTLGQWQGALRKQLAQGGAGCGFRGVSKLGEKDRAQRVVQVLKLFLPAKLSRLA